MKTGAANVQQQPVQCWQQLLPAPGLPSTSCLAHPPPLPWLQLEARNPTPEPHEARQALGGAWRLAYTSNSELIALLALGRLPLVTVGDITQTIDPSAMTVDNCVELQAPGRCAWACRA